VRQARDPLQGGRDVVDWCFPLAGNHPREEEPSKSNLVVVACLQLMGHCRLKKLASLLFISYLVIYLVG